MRVEIVGPLNNDWLGCLDCVLTLSVNILEKVERGGQWEELAPILKLILLGHLPQVAEVLDGESALGGNSIRGLAAVSDDEVLSCILRLSKEDVVFFVILVANASHLHLIPPYPLTTAIEDTDHIAAFHLCKRAQILFQRVHFCIIQVAHRCSILNAMASVVDVKESVYIFLTVLVDFTVDIRDRKLYLHAVGVFQSFYVSLFESEAAKALPHHFDVLHGLIDISVAFSGLFAQISIFATANNNGLSLVDLE